MSSKILSFKNRISELQKLSAEMGFHRNVRSELPYKLYGIMGEELDCFKIKSHTGVNSPLLLKSLLIWLGLLFFKLVKDPFELFQFHNVFRIGCFMNHIIWLISYNRVFMKKHENKDYETFLVSSTNSSLYIAYCILKTADCAWKNICTSSAKNAKIRNARKKMHRIRQWDHKSLSSMLKPSSDRILLASGHCILSAIIKFTRVRTH